MISPTDAKLAARLKPLALRPPGTLLVNEVYRSIQGEGLYAGLPCTFIRLTACHLRCSYCDSRYSFGQGDLVALDELVGRALALGDTVVEVTGGEPLLQAEVYPLMHQLVEAGRKVLLETSGAVGIEQVPPGVHVILDLKTPGSGEHEANLWSNLELLKPTDELKFVICDRRDFDWSLNAIGEHALIERCAVLMSPAFGLVNPTDLAAWILESGRPIRLQIQLHKQLWAPDARGV
ncbi:radical SAM protein [Isosphaeraceae bacterium EP7]